MVDKIRTLFNLNKIDTAIVSIFDFVDDVEHVNEITNLFEIFYNERFNEDIYVALLASTTYFKKNIARKEYYDFVKIELLRNNDYNEVEVILSGL